MSALLSKACMLLNDYDPPAGFYTPINTPNYTSRNLSHSRPKSDLFAEKKPPRATSSSLKMHYPPRSAGPRPGNALNSLLNARSHNNNSKTNDVHHDPFKSKLSPNVIIDNLNEDEFIDLLKEYRRTKSINLDCILTINASKSGKENAKTPSPNIERPKTVDEKISQTNLVKSYSSFDTNGSASNMHATVIET